MARSSKPGLRADTRGQTGTDGGHSTILILVILTAVVGFIAGSALGPGHAPSDLDRDEDTAVVECSVSTGNATTIICFTSGDVNFTMDTPEDWNDYTTGGTDG